MFRLKKALFIGRFQPLHLGHLDAIKQILDVYDYVQIIIGSAQHSSTQYNPLSLDTRKKMLEKALSVEGISNYEMIPIDDVNDDEGWIREVNSRTDYYMAYILHNPHVEKIFLEKGLPLKKVKKNIDIHATSIREMVREGDSRWRQYVHPSTLGILDEAGFEKTVREAS